MRLDKKLESYAPFQEDCANVPQSYCQKGSRYRYLAQFSNIREWRGKICSKSVQTRNNDHNIAVSDICAGGDCDPYVGPELYFEYLSRGVWKSMKNPSGQTPEGFEVPANSTKVYTYWWNSSGNTSFRLRVKNAMAKDEFDFMKDKLSGLAFISA